MGEAPAAAPAGDTGNQTPWHAGVDADILGTWQMKHYDLSDPKTVAIEATKAYNNAQQKLGHSPDFMLKLPTDQNDVAGWESVWQRLGAPADPKEYDFSSVKHADGSAPDPALLEAVRQAAAAVRAPKERAGEIANALLKHLDGTKASQAAEAAAKLAAEKAELAKSWGTNAEFNRLTAMQGAKRLGVDEETVAKLENAVGYSKVMEMFRKVGAGTREDTFHEGSRGNAGGFPATAEGAQSRLNELIADRAWGERLTNGDAAARREFDSLTQMIANAA